MKHFLQLVIFISFTCYAQETKQGCMPYCDAVAKGIIAERTNTIVFNDTLSYSLDFIRDQMYRDEIHSCYGHLELGNKEFKEVLKAVTNKYNPDNVFHIMLFTGDVDMCTGNYVYSENIKYLLVYHNTDNKKCRMDYINLETGETETHLISNFYASVALYYLFERSKIQNLPAAIGIVNRDFNERDIIYLDPKKDTTMRLVAFGNRYAKALKANKKL